MRRASLSGRSLAWAAPIVAEAGAFGRSVVFAWALGPEELGRAMMLALAVRLVEMASDVGIDRLIVQAPDGDAARLQSELHGACLLRGLLSALILLCLAPLLAAFLSDGPNVLSYMTLAVLPLIRAFGHLDYRRVERQFRHLKMAIVEGGATFAMAASLPLALWIVSDHRAMCIVLIAQAAAHTLLSHLIAERRYFVRFSLPTLERSWRFGAPLILNAGLLFVTFYADRFIVARAFSWEALALYGVALQLALLPAQIVGRAAGSLVLPRLRAALVRGRLDTEWQEIVMSYALLAAMMSATLAWATPIGIAWIYGESFRPDTLLAAALAIAAGFRVLRTPFSQRALVTGHIGDPARANVIRACALIPAAACASVGLPLASIAACAAMGEAGATLRAYHLSKARYCHPNTEEACA